MSRYLTLLSMELQSLDPKDYVVPHYKDEPGDNPAGTMNDAMKRLYTLWIQTNKHCDEMKVELRYKQSEPENVDPEILKQLDELSSKGKLLEKLFWLEVRSEFSLFDKPSVGLRHDYQIVWNNVRNDMPPFLKFMFGDPG